MPPMKEKDEKIMKDIFQRDYIKSLLKSVFSVYRKMVFEGEIDPEKAIREATALWITTNHHLAETRIRALVSMVEIRDYETPFKNVIPVRCQEKIDHLASSMEQEKNDVITILSDKKLPRSPFYEDPVSLVMSEVYPATIYGWEIYDNLKSKLFENINE